MRRFEAPRKVSTDISGRPNPQYAQGQTAAEQNKILPHSTKRAPPLVTVIKADGRATKQERPVRTTAGFRYPYPIYGKWFLSQLAQSNDGPVMMANGRHSRAGRMRLKSNP